MKFIRFCILTTLILLASPLFSKIIPSEIMLRFRDEVNQVVLSKLLDEYQGKIEQTRCFCGPNHTPLPKCPCVIDVVYLSKEITQEKSDELLTKLKTLPFIRIAEQNATVEPCSINHLLENPESMPSNLLKEQWNLQREDVQKAWRLLNKKYREGEPVKVAVIDSGVSDIPGLNENVLYNEGFNFANDNKDVNDTEGHGTKVTSIFGAVTNTLDHQSQPLAGLCWNRAQTVPLQYGDFTLGVIRAIYFAVHCNSKIINMSFSSEGSDIKQEAADYAANRGVLCIAAAGNQSASDPRYSAAYDSVLSVGSISESNSKAEHSNYGNWVDVGAPGESVPILNLKNKVEYAGDSLI